MFRFLPFLRLQHVDVLFFKGDVSLIAHCVDFLFLGLKFVIFTRVLPTHYVVILVGAHP